MTMTPHPLFVTGPARSGSTLLAMMLSAHSKLRVAADPCLPVFRSMRNAWLAAASPDVQRACAPNLPLQDFYFTDARIAALDIVINGAVDCPLPSGEWAELLPALVRRAHHASPDIAERLSRLAPATYRQFFDSLLGQIAAARSGGRASYVGFKDLWIIDFVEPLARAFPTARFIVMQRDPRAIVASMLAFAQTDPSQGADVLSYARHWRKQVAFLERFRQDAVLRDRVLVVSHEALVTEPQRVSLEMCRFLDVPFEPGMLDPNQYWDYSTGHVWRGNSSFEQALKGFQPELRHRWRSELPHDARALVELACGPDLPLAGYQADGVDEMTSAAAALRVLTSRATEPSWRSDLEDPQLDLGFELFRRVLLRARDLAADPAVVRRSYLFEAAFRAAQDAAPRSSFDAPVITAAR